MAQMLLIVNPVAGGGRALRAEPEVVRTLAQSGWEVTAVHTTSAAHATQLAAGASPGQVVGVLAGDGVLARALEGAYQSGAVVAPLPGGRGNDLIRVLGVPTDPVQAARRLNTQARERAVDVGRCNGRFFMGVAALGIAALANQVANETEWLTGTPVYVWGVLKALATARPVRYTITVDGVTATRSGWNVAVGNGGYLGGRMHVCPGARLDDGLLEFNFIRYAPRFLVAPVLGKIFSGRHVEMPEVTARQAREIRISADRPAAVYADGEYLDSLPATFTVEPAAVRVLA